MNCKKVIERMSQFWSGELDEVSKKEMEAHLQSCSICQEEWEAMNAAMFALKNVTTPEPPTELLNQIKNAVRIKQTQKTKKAPVWQWRWAFAAVGIAIPLLLLFAFLSPFQERTDAPVVKKIAESLPSEPTFERILPPSSSQPSVPTMKVRPSPRERIKKPSRPSPETEIARKKSSEKSQLVAPSLAEKLPTLELPYGESLAEQPQKEIPTPVLPQPEQNAPKIAELPFEQRKVPFRAEIELKEPLKVPVLEKSESTLASRSQSSPPSTEPMVARQKDEEKTRVFDIIKPMPLMMQQGSNLQQAVVATPFQLRWVRFEPVVLGKVRLWELGLISESQQIVKVWVQPGEKIEVLNAFQQFPTEAKSLVLWHDKLTASKEAIIPILVRANELGTRKVLMTVETAEGKTFSWWFVFPVMLKIETIRFRHPIAFQIEQWKVLDLLSHIAWESRFAFLLPEQVAQRVVNLPMKTMSVPEILALLEQQIGGRFIRFGNTISWIGPIPSLAAPMTNRQ